MDVDLHLIGYLNRSLLSQAGSTTACSVAEPGSEPTLVRPKALLALLMTIYFGYLHSQGHDVDACTKGGFEIKWPVDSSTLSSSQGACSQA